MGYREQLNECTDPKPGDWLEITNTGNATDKEQKVNASRFAILAEPNAFTGLNSFSTTVGLTGSKSAVPHNSATNICRIAIGGGAQIAASYLIAIALVSNNTTSSVIYLVSQGYSTAAIAEQAEALFGHSAVTVTATADAANRRVTLSLTQVNSSSQAVDITISVLPLLVWNGATITLTML